MTAADARRVVIHADDLGMSHGANAAFAELWRMGTATSGSVMVPCPWFAELATMARADPTLDIGVHLTLTSEMKGYRWRPLTCPPASSGLTDGEGFFHADVPTLRARADPAAVEAELRAQIEVALGAGIDATHLDDHMGAVLAPEFATVCLRLAVDYGLPPVFCGTLAAYGGQHNMSGVCESDFASGVAAARALHVPIFDRIAETDWHRRDTPDRAYRALFEGLGPGLSFLALHFTAPGEIEAIDPAFHHIRTDEYALFRSEDFATWLRSRRIALIGMRALRDDWRALRAAGGLGWKDSASA